MINNEYFLVSYPLAINVEKLKEQQEIPEYLAFEQEIPAPFRMASEIATLDSQALQPLKLSNDATKALVGFLQLQNQKINTLLTYVLSQQDDPTLRYQTTSFSAGNCVFEQKEADTFSIGDKVLLKLFIPEESAAVYCYASVTSIEGKYIQLSYQQIRDEDREMLIRTTLHIQSKQLKLRAAQRTQSL